MPFETIEEVLGKRLVEAVVEAVHAAFVASRQAHSVSGPSALQELLIAMLVATSSADSQFALASVDIERAANRMKELVDVIREEQERSPTRN